MWIFIIFIRFLSWFSISLRYPRPGLFFWHRSWNRLACLSQTYWKHILNRLVWHYLPYVQAVFCLHWCFCSYHFHFISRGTKACVYCMSKKAWSIYILNWHIKWVKPSWTCNICSFIVRNYFSNDKLCNFLPYWDWDT